MGAWRWRGVLLRSRNYAKTVSHRHLDCSYCILPCCLNPHLYYLCHKVPDYKFPQGVGSWSKLPMSIKDRKQIYIYINKKMLSTVYRRGIQDDSGPTQIWVWLCSFSGNQVTTSFSNDDGSPSCVSKNICV